MTATVYGIEKYLGSGLVKGIGQRLAQIIVKQSGHDIVEVIETDIERLYDVPGIGRKRVEKIRESWEKLMKDLSVKPLIRLISILKCIILKLIPPQTENLLCDKN